MKQYFEIPDICPSCGHPTKIDGKFLMCPNDNCDALAYGNLYKWIAVLEIKNIGNSIIEMLFEKGIVSEPADFYKLSVNDIADLERLGEKSANKILENLNNKKEIPLDIFIGALNMSNFSTSTAKMLIEAGYDTIEKMQNITGSELVQIKGIEEKTAKQILNGLQSKADIIKNLFDVGITIKKIEINKDGKLSGLSFCVTGSLESMKRKDFEKLVVENGGSFKGISKDLSYLVNNDPNSTSSKNKKAKELNIKIITEKEFLDLL